MTGAAQEWIARAKKDQGTFEKPQDDEDLTNVATVHAQRCIEKGFKARIEAAGKPVPRIPAYPSAGLYSLILFPESGIL